MNTFKNRNLAVFLAVLSVALAVATQFFSFNSSTFFGLVSVFGLCICLLMPEKMKKGVAERFYKTKSFLISYGWSGYLSLIMLFILLAIVDNPLISVVETVLAYSVIALNVSITFLFMNNGFFSKKSKERMSKVAEEATDEVA